MIEARRLHSSLTMARSKFRIRRAHRKPDGSFMVGSNAYRLNEVGRGEFDVVGDGEDAPAGTILVRTRRFEPLITVRSGAHRPDVVEAVAAALRAPTGLLPLQ